MRLVFAAAVWCMSMTAGAVAADGGDVARFQNAYYTATVTKANGGLIDTLRCRATEEIIISRMRIYTDHGIYPARQYVGTGSSSATTFEVRREENALVTTAEGKLVGKAAEGKPPVNYKVRMRFDDSPVIHVSAAVQPHVTKNDLRGFMALCWQVPSLFRWYLRTIEGLIRHTYQPGTDDRRRQFSHQWPMDPVRPLIGLQTSRGAELRITGLRWSGIPSFTGPVIHGRAIFLCWLDGAPRNLVAGQWATLEFDLTVRGPVGQK